MTKEQDFKCQRILFTYEQMISDCIEKRKEARPALQQDWRDIEREYRTEALDFLKRYSQMYLHEAG